MQAKAQVRLPPWEMPPMLSSACFCATQHSHSWNRGCAPAPPLKCRPTGSSAMQVTGSIQTQELLHGETIFDPLQSSRVLSRANQDFTP